CLQGCSGNGDRSEVKRGQPVRQFSDADRIATISMETEGRSMNIRIKLLGTVALVRGMIAGCAGGDGGASAGRSVLATQSVGGSYHALGSGLASMVTDRTDVGMTVQPYSGPNAWIPELDDNTIQFGLGSVIDAGWAYEGGPGFEK